MDGEDEDEQAVHRFWAAATPTGGQGTDTGKGLTVEFAVRAGTTEPQAHEVETVSEASRILNKLEFYDCNSSSEVEFVGEFVNDPLRRIVIGTTPLGVPFDFSPTLEFEAEVQTTDPAHPGRREGPRERPRIRRGRGPPPRAPIRRRHPARAPLRQAH
jgi:hypothetical protein